MDTDKLSRNITMQCPACGGTEFKHDDESDSGPIECNSCGRLTTREELVAENGANIEANLDEVKKAAVKEVEAAIKKAFGGNRTIKIKL
jgi:uncharacterized Zn finger protein (UPF0148 family)